MIAVDTNVLLYVHDPRDVRKQQIAGELVKSIRDPVLLWQVACEFLAAARKLSQVGFTVEMAFDEIDSLRTNWKCGELSWAALDEARHLRARYSLSTWDALLVASCVVHRCEKLYTEDFSGYGKIAGVEIVNPFRE